MKMGLKYGEAGRGREEEEKRERDHRKGVGPDRAMATTGIKY